MTPGEQLIQQLKENSQQPQQQPQHQPQQQQRYSILNQQKPKEYQSKPESNKIKTALMIGAIALSVFTTGLVSNLAFAGLTIGAIINGVKKVLEQRKAEKQDQDTYEEAPAKRR